MAVFSGPEIINTNFRMYLDAANSRSYPGTGTTWTDLSGNGYSGVLNNSPAFSTAVNGEFTFDGVDDYVTLPLNFFNHVTAGPFSISVWFKTSVAAGTILGQTSTSNFLTSGGHVPAIYVNTAGNLSTSCFWGGSTANRSISTAVVNTNTWRNSVVTFASGVQKSYLDGELYATLSKTQTSYNTDYYYWLGVGRNGWPLAGSPYFNGSIALFCFYNQELTAAQVGQNYQALLPRFYP
jgi:hypothetical protein